MHQERPGAATYSALSVSPPAPGLPISGWTELHGAREALLPKVQSQVCGVDLPGSPRLTLTPAPRGIQPIDQASLGRFIPTPEEVGPSRRFSVKVDKPT